MPPIYLLSLAHIQVVEIPEVIVEELHTCLICEGETKEVSVHIESRTWQSLSIFNDSVNPSYKN